MNTGPELHKNNNGLRSIHYLGKEFNVPLLDREQLLKKISSIPDLDKTLILIPSPVFFDAVAKLLDLLPPSAHLLCVEADQNLMAFSVEHASRCSTAISSSMVTYIRTNSTTAAAETVESLGIWRFRRCFMVTLNRVYSLHGGEYTAMYNKIQEIIRTYWQNKMTLIHMANMWIKNLFKNLYHCSGALPLTALTIPKPACIIGAGESLEGSIETLRTFKDRLFLICVDTALPVLRESGIAPDLLIVLETQSINLKDFIGQDNRDIPVAIDLTSHPGIHSIFRGNKYYFLSEFASCSLITDMRQQFPEIHLSPSLGSVGVTAIYIASFLTKFPIFFTGLDFSYAPGKPHARGAPSQLSSLSISNRLNPPGYYESTMNRPLKLAADKNGRERHTDAVLQSYINPLNLIMEKNRRYYDIGKSGLPTGAAVLKTDVEIEEVLNGVPVKDNPCTISETGKAGYPAGISRERIDLFLQEKRLLLSEIVSLGSGIITGNRKGPPQEIIEEKLSNADFIYAHFPETPPLPYQNISFIKRITVSAGYYLSIIDNLLSL